MYTLSVVTLKNNNVVFNKRLLIYLFFCSLSECYFAGKGAALVLPAAEAQKACKPAGANGSNIQKHLQSMFYLLRPEETLKMVSVFFLT